MTEHKLFAHIKSDVSDCICRTCVLLEKKIPETVLNMLSNEYTDRIISTIEGDK